VDYYFFIGNVASLPESITKYDTIIYPDSTLVFWVDVPMTDFPTKFTLLEVEDRSELTLIKLVDDSSFIGKLSSNIDEKINNKSYPFRREIILESSEFTNIWEELKQRNI
jgi:hypothetical protein